MDQLQNYGFNTQQYEESGYMPIRSLTINLDLAKVLTAYNEGMKAAFHMGRQARADELGIALPQNLPSPTQASPLPVLPTSAPAKEYLGVFDRYAYGVYDDQGKLSNSARFWDSASLNVQTFASYEDALAYASNGAAAYHQIPIESLTPLAHKINWRQQAKGGDC